MTALLRYQSALLLRSQRWLPPVLLYGIFVAVGAQAGDPVLDSLGYAAAALLPVTAWLVRLCATQEPAAARHVTAAASSPGRTHRAALLTALGAAGVLGAAGTVVIMAMSDWASADHRVEVAPVAAAAAGLAGAVVCALTGAAVGALCTWPLLRSPGWSLALTALAALLSLVTTGSPAQAAVTGLISGSRTGTVHVPLLPLAVAALVACAAGAVACAVSSRRA
ncbi:ABC transporter [Streptomyces monticola]|uniref:ABC transporter n=1 Tax=Streptomyces monticola TaxID=2666263 RepID=A0ABW2JBK2_9ACTN